MSEAGLDLVDILNCIHKLLLNNEAIIKHSASAHLAERCCRGSRAYRLRGRIVGDIYGDRSCFSGTFYVVSRGKESIEPFDEIVMSSEQRRDSFGDFRRVDPGEIMRH